MLDLNAMVVFAQVVEQGSFVGAARSLGLPKATVSRRIQNLEDSLQVRLLERSTRVVRPTEIGRIFYDYCDRIATESTEAEAAIHEQQTEPSGTLRFSAPSAFTYLFLKALLPEFLARYPKIRVIAEIANWAVNPLREGFDLSIRAGSLEDSSLQIQLLGEVCLKLFASPDYLAQHGAPQAPAELAQHHTIDCQIATDAIVWNLHCAESHQSISHNPRCIINDPTISHSLVLSGLGIGLLPTFICAGAVDSGELLPVLPAWQADPILLSAIYPSVKQHALKGKVFLACLQEHLSQISSPQS